MPARETYEVQRTIDEARRRLEADALLHVRTRIYVHDLGPGGTCCPCCGSTTAVVVREIEDIDLLVDPESGERVLRGPENAAGFDDLAATARRIDVPIRCSVAQLPVLLCTSPLIFVSGGSRAGKSQIAAWWFLRRLLLRGGRGRLFWILGPSLRACWISLGKLLLGREGKPPIVPTGPDGAPLLAVRWPDNEKQRDLRVVLIDGTVIDLRPLSRRGAEQIRGESLMDALLEEATAIRRLEHYVEAQARVSEEGGSLLASTTPDPPHFLEDTIAAAEREQAAAEDRDEVPRVVHFPMTRWSNPWLDPERIASDEQQLRDTAGEAAVQRQIYGRWVVADGGRFWRHWSPDLLLPPRESADLDRCTAPDGTRIVDVTERALRRFVDWSGDAGWFVKGHRASNLRWVCGLDVNRRPCSLMALKIWAPADKLEDTGAWGVAVVAEVGLSYAESMAAFADYAAAAVGGRFAGTLVYADPQHCHRDKDLRAHGGNGGNESAKAMTLAGFDCRPAGTRSQVRTDLSRVAPRLPSSPSRGDSHELLQRLMFEKRFLVSPQCPRLLDALEKQQPRPGFNEPLKGANTAADRLSNAIDGVRYAVWRLFGAQDGPTLR